MATSVVAGQNVEADRAAGGAVTAAAKSLCDERLAGYSNPAALDRLRAISKTDEA